MSISENIQQVARDTARLKEEVNKIFIGQDELVEGTLAALFSEGHVLIEGVPGLGKTLLVRTLGKLLGCKFGRIQFTPDLMPSDITGSHIYHQKEQKFMFMKGPLFTNLLLADEINRAPAKTHSALLEIMQESQVTIDNRQYVIQPPFFVMATQNPVESEGTYSLPEAQLDRFLLKLKIEYPSADEEKKVYRLHAGHEAVDPEQRLEALLNPEKVIALQKSAAEVRVSEALIDYITALVRETRNKRDIYLGCSPRAGIALLKTARAIALMEGRDYVVPDDVKRMVLPAFRHRILLNPEAEVEGRVPDDVIMEVVESVEIPSEGSRSAPSVDSSATAAPPKSPSGGDNPHGGRYMDDPVMGG